MKNPETSKFEKYRNYYMPTLIVLRLAIGWHFFYEGLVKLLNPTWSAANFLNGSRGFLSGFFNWLASDPAILNVVDFLNVWGLLLIGIGLFIGFITRISVYGGILLLMMYYLCKSPRCKYQMLYLM